MSGLVLSASSASYSSSQDLFVAFSKDAAVFFFLVVPYYIRTIMCCACGALYFDRKCCSRAQDADAARGAPRGLPGGRAGARAGRRLARSPSGGRAAGGRRARRADGRRERRRRRRDALRGARGLRARRAAHRVRAGHHCGARAASVHRSRRRRQPLQAAPAPLGAHRPLRRAVRARLPGASTTTSNIINRITQMYSTRTSRAVETPLELGF